MVELFVEVCRRKGLKVSAYKSRVMVVGWEKQKTQCHEKLDISCDHSTVQKERREERMQQL